MRCAMCDVRCAMWRACVAVTGPGQAARRAQRTCQVEFRRARERLFVDDQRQRRRRCSSMSSLITAPQCPPRSLITSIGLSALSYHDIPSASNLTQQRNFTNELRQFTDSQHPDILPSLTFSKILSSEKHELFHASFRSSPLTAQ